MTRRNVKPEPNLLVRAAYRGWPPTCQLCGWTGTPSQTESPYLNCGGDPAKHQRQPVRTGATP